MADEPIGGAPAPVIRFDPSEWLARFEAAGGYVLVDGRSGRGFFGWGLEKANDEGAFPRAIYAEVEGNRARLEAVKALAPVVLREAV